MQILIWANIVLGILILIFLLIVSYKSTEKNDKYMIYGFMCLLINSLIFSNLIMLCMPQAIDVYRGQTELEITSVNNEPVDTIVVWKNDR